jgi:hypothetical protein
MNRKKCVGNGSSRACRVADKRLMHGLAKARLTDHGDPQTPKDKALSRKHLVDRLAFDGRHAEDHREAAAESGHDPKWNLGHAKEHEKRMEKTMASLAGRKK